MRKILPLILIVMLAYPLSACSVYKVAVDERDIGNQAEDEKITLLIKEQFLEDDLVKYLDFDAACYYGKVYIVGEYESQAQIDRAVAIAKNVEGVRSVIRYLLPKKANDTCGTSDNLEIYGRLTKTLVSDDNIWSTNINVKVVQCNVVLLGIVGSQKEVDLAIKHAKATPGVRSVKSYLRVDTR